MTMSPAEVRDATTPSERSVTGGVLFLLAGLAALGALATNIILPAFSRIGAELAISSPELGLLLKPDWSAPSSVAWIRGFACMCASTHAA
jgi:hypothetical protein